MVTGGAGFIGSAFIRLAIAKGHSVVNVDALTYAACAENVATVKKYSSYSFEHVDIQNYEALMTVFRTYLPAVLALIFMMPAPLPLALVFLIMY